QVAFLAGAQRGTGDNQFRFVLRNALLQFLDFALAYEKSGVGRLAPAYEFIDHASACRSCKLGKFLAFQDIGGSIGCRMNQNGTFAASRSLKQSGPPGPATDWSQSSLSPASSSGNGKRTLRAGTTVDIACLYTIWFTLFFGNTTNWSNESTCPWSLIPFTR